MPAKLRRPCSYCGRWFRRSARVKNAKACSADECRRLRKQEAQRTWKRSSRENRGSRLKQVFALRPETYVKVPQNWMGDAISRQVPTNQKLAPVVPSNREGDAIRLQGVVLLGLIRLVLRGVPGDTIASALLRLENSGKAVLGGTG
jgi:hypothetical protein